MADMDYAAINAWIDAQRLHMRYGESGNWTAPGTEPSVSLACRLAKACAVCHRIGLDDLESHVYYNDIGFLVPPDIIVADAINAAMIGTTATETMLIFRGTEAFESMTWPYFVDSLLDWLNDSKAVLTRANYTPGLVHSGFAEALEELWPDSLEAIQRQQDMEGGKKPLIVAGHSKGGALAALAAVRLLVGCGVIPRAVCTFGAPRAGNIQFARNCDQLIPQHWRFEFADDIVPHLVPAAQWLDFIGELDSRLSGLSAYAYLHAGKLMFLNWGGGLTQTDSFVLRAERMLRCAAVAASGQILMFPGQHSLVHSYVPRLESLPAVDLDPVLR